VEGESYVEPAQDRLQADDVVGVQVRSDHQVDPLEPPALQGAGDQLGVPAAVDQDAGTGRALDQGGVTFADVEERHPQAGRRR
jgi:hypothetical protein